MQNLPHLDHVALTRRERRGGRIGVVQNSPCRPLPGSQVKNGYAAPRAHSQTNWISNQLPSGERWFAGVYLDHSPLLLCEIVSMNVMCFVFEFFFM